MIQTESKLIVADNSGAKVAVCIKVLGGPARGVAKIGSKIVVSVKKAIPISSSSKRSGKGVKKGDVFTGVVVRTVSPIYRKDGSSLSFSENAVVLLNKQGDPIATAVSGSIPREVSSKYSKIGSIVESVV